MDTEQNHPRVAIVLSFQQLPLKLLSAYGSELGQTPHFDRMAARGIVFDQHFADDLSEVRNRHAWWDGMTSFTAENHSTAQHILPQLCDLSDIECHLISDSPPAEWDIAPSGWKSTFLETVSESASENLSELFATTLSTIEDLRERGKSAIVWVYSHELPSVPIPDMTFLNLYLNELPQLALLETDSTSSEDNEDEAATDISEDERTAAFELIEETLSVLTDEETEPKAAHIKTLNVLAAARLSEWDHELGKFFDQIEPDLNAERSLLLVTSDRGLPLLESSITKQLERNQIPGPLQEETTHLPLLLVRGEQKLGERIGALTSPADIPATLLDWFGIVSEEIEGRSLWLLLEGETEILHPYLTCRAGEWESLREPEWLLIRNRREGVEKLYIEPEDRWQVLDVLSQYIDEADRLIAILNQCTRS